MTKHPIKIIGGELFVANTGSALDLLINEAKEYYDFTLKYIGVIEYVNAGSGIYVMEKPPRLLVGFETANSDRVWYASAIVHDANHSRQYQDYLLKNPDCQDVPRDAYSGEAAEKDCLEVQWAVLEKLRAPEQYLSHVRNGLKRKYWEVKYKDRWW